MSSWRVHRHRGHAANILHERAEAKPCQALPPQQQMLPTDLRMVNTLGVDKASGVPATIVAKGPASQPAPRSEIGWRGDLHHARKLNCGSQLGV
jgi:hypothetical protein